MRGGHCSFIPGTSGQHGERPGPPPPDRATMRRDRRASCCGDLHGDCPLVSLCFCKLRVVRDYFKTFRAEPRLLVFKDEILFPVSLLLGKTDSALD